MITEAIARLKRAPGSNLLSDINATVDKCKALAI
jgi:hypothetical protein